MEKSGFFFLAANAVPNLYIRTLKTNISLVLQFVSKYSIKIKTVY